jgi:hypothetical protein
LGEPDSVGAKSAYKRRRNLGITLYFNTQYGSQQGCLNLRFPSQVRDRMQAVTLYQRIREHEIRLNQVDVIDCHIVCIHAQRSGCSYHFMQYSTGDDLPSPSAKFYGSGGLQSEQSGPEFIHQFQ